VDDALNMPATFARFLQRRRTPDPRGTAAAIRNLLDAAEEPASDWRAHGIDPPLRAAAVLAARADLLAIATALECERDHPAQLLDCVSWLAWSRESPVCMRPADDDAEVKAMAGRIRVALGE
jgi:hypothetical protein